MGYLLSRYQEQHAHQISVFMLNANLALTDRGPALSFFVGYTRRVNGAYSGGTRALQDWLATSAAALGIQRGTRRRDIPQSPWTRSPNPGSHTSQNPSSQYRK